MVQPTIPGSVSSTYLIRKIMIRGSYLNDDQLCEIVFSIRNHCMLAELNLTENRVGMSGPSGCDALGGMLRDPNSSIVELKLGSNCITDHCLLLIAGALQNNRKLQRLHLEYNYAYTPDRLLLLFRRLICNTASINATFCSNHTLKVIKSYGDSSIELQRLLALNRGIDEERLIAKRKILLFHQHINFKKHIVY